MTKLKQYLITTCVGLLLTFLIAFLRDLASQTETKEIIKILCDSFFVSGILLTCVGLLIVASNLGAFEMLIYGMTSFIDYFRKKSERKYASFYDYHESRANSKTSFWYMLIIGLALIGVSLIFLMAYEAL